MMPVPFRWTAGEVPAGSGRGEARGAGGGGGSASTPQPPPAVRAALATAAAAAAAAAEAQLPPHPPTKGSTDNKSWAEKRRAEKANRAPNSVTPPCPRLPRLCWARVPEDPGTAGGSEGPCAPAAAGDRGGPSGQPQVPSGESPLPGAGWTWPGARGLLERGPPRCSGSAHRCRDWQERRRRSRLSPLLSPPPLFSHPLFRRHQLQQLGSVKNVKEIFPATGGGDHVLGSRPLFETLACPSDLYSGSPEM